PWLVFRFEVALQAKGLLHTSPGHRPGYLFRYPFAGRRPASPTWTFVLGVSLELGAWSLELLWMLDVGIWMFLTHALPRTPRPHGQPRHRRLHQNGHRRLPGRVRTRLLGRLRPQL